MKDRCVFRRTTISDGPTLRWRCSRKAATTIQYEDTVLQRTEHARVCRQHANHILAKAHIYAPNCKGAVEIMTPNESIKRGE